MSKLSPSEWERVTTTPGMMPTEHLEWLAETACTISSWTEVGVYCGRSALAVGLSLPQPAILQLVETHIRSELFLNLDWLFAHRPYLTTILCVATSVQAAKVLPQTDVVFIDDDHSYDGVFASISAWKDRCRLLCGHDYDNSETPYPPHEGVKRAVDELCPNVFHPCEEIRGLWVRR